MHPAPASEHESHYDGETNAPWHETHDTVPRWDMERLLVWGLVLIGVAVVLLAAFV